MSFLDEGDVPSVMFISIFNEDSSSQSLDNIGFRDQPPFMCSPSSWVVEMVMMTPVVMMMMAMKMIIYDRGDGGNGKIPSSRLSDSYTWS